MKKIKRISRIEIEESLDVNSKEPEPLYCSDTDVAVLEARIGELEQMTMSINIIFDGPPGTVGGRFVEVETDDGASIDVGEWIELSEGLWALRITQLPKENNDD